MSLILKEFQKLTGGSISSVYKKQQTWKAASKCTSPVHQRHVCLKVQINAQCLKSTMFEDLI